MSIVSTCPTSESCVSRLSSCSGRDARAGTGYVFLYLFISLLISFFLSSPVELLISISTTISFIPSFFFFSLGTMTLSPRSSVATRTASIYRTHLMPGTYVCPSPSRPTYTIRFNFTAALQFLRRDLWHHFSVLYSSFLSYCRREKLMFQSKQQLLEPVRRPSLWR